MISERNQAVIDAILDGANQGLYRSDFLRSVCGKIIGETDCIAVELRIAGGSDEFIWTSVNGPTGCVHHITKVRFAHHDQSGSIPCCEEDSLYERLIHDLFRPRYDPQAKTTWKRSGLYIPDTSKRLTFSSAEWETTESGLDRVSGAKALLLVPFDYGIFPERHGLIILKWDRIDPIHPDEAEMWEETFQMLGTGLAFRRSQAALKERIKELTCLSGLHQLSEAHDFDIEDFLQGVVSLIPPAFQYPNITFSRIRVKDKYFETPGFAPAPLQLVSKIPGEEETWGELVVVYLADRQGDQTEPPEFLNEEQNLIDIMTGKIGLILDAVETRKRSRLLEEQLVHTERLATIGQLASGFAHELNEPLANILGFAQLVQKHPDLPESLTGDLGKIVKSSLHAREIVRNLLLFSRQMPARLETVDIEKVLGQALDIVGVRLQKGSVRIVREFSGNCPTIPADPSQLVQVFVNLLINAEQAMPSGGTITLKTFTAINSLKVQVADTGVGMEPATIDRIFLPFFTTKEIGQGTGLGLSVAHGIIEAHRGTIDVNSKTGQGTTFTISFPLV